MILFISAMRRIRYKEINTYEHEVILPDYSKDPIGIVYKDAYRGKDYWNMQPKFVTLLKDSKIINYKYKDFSSAGKAMVDIWERTMFLTNREDTAEYNISDIFKDLGP